MYDALTGKIARNLVGHRSCVRDVSWHPFQPEIVSSSVRESFFNDVMWGGGGGGHSGPKWLNMCNVSFKVGYVYSQDTKIGSCIIKCFVKLIANSALQPNLRKFPHYCCERVIAHDVIKYRLNLGKRNLP